MQFKWVFFGIIIIFCTLGTISVGYITYTSTPPSSSSTFIEVLKTMFLCLGGIGVIMPLYISAMDSIDDRKYNKIENTFSMLTKWDDPHLFSARKLTREIASTRSSISDDELINRINNEGELKQSFILVFNYFESIRFSILNDRIDKKQFRKSLGTVILDIIHRFKPFVKTLGEENIKDIEQLEKLLSDS